ncbi:MAG: TlyA family RNA methyltransferase [Clostridia bacterium]|nr:TlyA family RNA methyltransferase [Clostridia bacterium]
MNEQTRLDMLLVARGLVSGRDRAKELITQGQVLVNGQKATKAAQKYDAAVPLEILNDAAHFVSRAAHKLEGALQSFGIDLTGRIVMDVGASTGGFTQCALEKGAARVYAVDVGSGQLAPQLAADERVHNFEKTDIRLLQQEQLPIVPDFAACDVSFISLRLVLPAIAALLSPKGEAVVLIKPQFEAGRSAVGRGGLVKDAKVHVRVLREMIDTFHANGFLIAGMAVSPITGGDGNIEFLAFLRREGEENIPDPECLVRTAHRLK